MLGKIIVLRTLRVTLVVVLIFCDGMGLRMLDRPSLPADRQVQMVEARSLMSVCYSPVLSLNDGTSLTLTNEASLSNVSSKSIGDEGKTAECNV